MTISNLQHRLINFAGGMPAFALSYRELIREIEAIKAKLEGVYPDQPSNFMKDIPMPVYGLAYSGFVSRLDVNRSGNSVTVDSEIRATIHLRGSPSSIIREYIVRTVDPIVLVLDYDQSARKLFWREQGLAVTDMVGAWGADADVYLAQTGLPQPQRDSFLQEVELPSIWTTKNMFVNLLIALLPFYETAELADWLTLLDPLRFDYDADHILVTASRATMALGGCDPSMVTIEPDPSFPYGIPLPGASFSAEEIAYAVYLPKTRLIDFTAKVLEPAVLVNSGGGGFIKWSLSGAFGLKRLVADITTSFGTGGANASVVGTIGIDASIDFVGAARAWIDGPSGIKIGLASASVIGSGVFESEVRFTANLNAGVIAADLVIQRSEITDVDFDVNTPLGWPIDDIAGEILDQVAYHEVKKLTGKIYQLGRWDFMGIPFSMRDSLTQWEAVSPAMEGLAGVCAYVGMVRVGIG